MNIDYLHIHPYDFIISWAKYISMWRCPSLDSVDWPKYVLMWRRVQLPSPADCQANMALFGVPIVPVHWFQSTTNQGWYYPHDWICTTRNTRGSVYPSTGLSSLFMLALIMIWSQQKSVVIPMLLLVSLLLFSIGYVTLVAISGTTIWTPCHKVKSPQLI